MIPLVVTAVMTQAVGYAVFAASAPELAGR
jgi:hypothetical protein